ncbi:MAG: hypothetical protein ACI4RJ_00950 [Alphaproteobacteria bacterium]
MTEQAKQNNGIGIGSLITLVVICIGIYIWVVSAFPQSIVCKEDASPTMCECIRYRISKNVPFLEKLKILIMGASAEELNSYLDVKEALICAVSEIGK